MRCWRLPGRAVSRGEAVIRFEQVFMRYPGGRDALRDLSFRIPAGEMVFLTGHSGAGKSTLLKLIACIERPTRGQVLIGGRNTGGITRRRVPAFRRRIGMVFQDHKLLGDRTVFDNVALPMVIAGVGSRETGRRVRAALDQVGLLGKEQLPPIMLSTGEQQRVGIARAIAARPPLLIADEPTGNLDPELSLEIMYLFARLNRAGTTVLVASHDLHLLEQMGYRRIALSEGRLTEDLDHAFPGAPA
jgi:cell division transport system ATP-binding protein